MAISVSLTALSEGLLIATSALLVVFVVAWLIGRRRPEKTMTPSTVVFVGAAAAVCLIMTILALVFDGGVDVL